MECHFITLI